MHISPSEVQETDTIIDVRTPIEYRSKHIPGSYNIPLSDIETYQEELQDIENAVILCRTGRRAAQACAIIGSDAEVIEGGIVAWEQAGKEVVTGRNIWDLQRQVRFSAGALVLVGVFLGYLVAIEYFLISAFVGAGLTHSGLSGSCAMAMILEKLPWNRTDHDTQKVVERLHKDTA